MPQYTDAQINKRVSSGKDERRARSYDVLANQATQPPHDDDAEAMGRLQQLAQTAGTNDARNYARMKLRDITGGPQPDYAEARDGGGFLGSVGSVVKKLAPLAAFIPGVGPLAAGGIAAAANTGGSLLKHEGIDLKGSLVDGLLAGVGNKLMAKPNAAPGDIGQADQLSMPNGVMQSAGEVARPSLGGQLVNQFKNPSGTLDFSKLAGVGGAGLKVYENQRARNTTERLANANLQMQQRGLQQAEQGYADKAGIRKQALARLGNMQGGSIFGGQR